MRRPVLYLAGMLLATGASLALAGPASAAVDGGKKHHKHHHHLSWFWDNDGCEDEGDFYNSGIYSTSSYEHNEMNGVNIPILSNVGSGSLLGLGG